MPPSTPVPGLQLAPAPRAQARRGGETAFGRVAVYDNLNAVAPIWAELEAVCPASVYQARGWLAVWQETMGADLGVTPMIVVIESRDGTALGLLPLGLSTRGGLRVASFLGGRDSNANMGLFRPGVRFEPAHLRALFAAAARGADRRPDVFMLLDQPATWEGAANPLAPLFRQSSPSACHATRLAADFPTYVAAKLGAEARKKLTKKRRRLERELGPLAHQTPREPAEIDAALDAFFEQKLARFRAQGIASDFERAAARDFLRRGSLENGLGGSPPLELHVLKAGDRIVATYGGALHRRRFHAMFNSYDMAEDAARCSPGDLLLMAMLEQMTTRGVEVFDLGVGEARYKDAWCETIEPMFDALVPVSARGFVFALREAARLRAKRWVKQTPWLWSAARRMRKLLKATKAAP